MADRASKQYSLHVIALGMSVKAVRFEANIFDLKSQTSSTLHWLPCLPCGNALTFLSSYQNKYGLWITYPAKRAQLQHSLSAPPDTTKKSLQRNVQHRHHHEAIPRCWDHACRVTTPHRWQSFARRGRWVLTCTLMKEDCGSLHMLGALFKCI